MSKIENKNAERSNLLNTLSLRFSYQQMRHQLGDPNCSMDKIYRMLAWMVEIDEFVDYSLTSDVPVWEMPKTATRYLSCSLTHVGERFYQIMASAAEIVGLPDCYQLGENQSLFNSLCRDLELNPGVLKKDPMHTQGRYGPIEGEFVNGFLVCLRQSARELKFRGRVKARSIEANRQLREAKKLIASLSSKVNVVRGNWITLEYSQSGAFPPSLSHLESDLHLRDFSFGLQDMAMQFGIIGQIWFRNFLPETGFRIRMLLLRPHSNGPDMNAALESALGQLWKNVTKGCGIFTYDPNWMWPDAIDKMLKAHVSAEKIIRMHPEGGKYFGCFDSCAMSNNGLNGHPPS